MTQKTKLTKTQKKAKRFLAKIVGDTGEKILHKAMREIGPVVVLASKDAGYAVEISGAFRGSGKSLSSAVRQAVKAWTAAQ